MKAVTSNFLHKIIVVLCLFALGNTYGQVQKSTPKTLFGKTVSPESINPKTGNIRCATTEYEQFLQEKSSKRMTDAQFEAWLNPLVKQYRTMRTTSKTAATIITIPVVVHVIHSGQAVGTAQNISDAQVQSQITVLNEDFRKMLNSPGYNTNPVGADVEIEFVLALQDPNGNPTNGIDRINFCQSTWSLEEIESTVKPATFWDPNQYLNMWSVAFSNSSDLGYAQYPDASGLPGLDANGGNANTDGVVSGYSVFGSKTYDVNNNFSLDATYNKGRTMTHEVGHWLGLRHIWGDSTCGDDFCADTPVHHDKNFGCPTKLSCNSTTINEMVQNYMDYTDDACMNIFTLGQKDRIMVIMNNAARRKSLKNSTKASPVTPLFANDAEIKIEAGKCIVTPENAGCNTPPPSNKQVAIYNRGTTPLTSVTLNYTLNGGTNQTNTWNGSLAQNQSAVVTLLNTDSYGVLNVSVATTNGGTDQRASNNTATATYTAPAIPTNYTFNTFTFRLQQDLWGSETTWNIKDSSGLILYSSVPYTDKDNLPLPTLITQNWTLASNKCYTFTITDSQGDGICCGDEGNGYYDIKSTDGLITVISGSDFGYSDSKSFTIGTLGTNEFETSSDIYLYPNPTKGTLNIRIPSAFGLPDSYSISNVLGQKISQKNISKETDLTINTATLTNGVYFITVVKEDQKRTLRFIKE
ncbi:Por secretion system C-terminal sorting domain-containing protein [Flavobacterium fluvii]|uniref:Por secretion system C-terminal sorting domain-containing protein n=1 Tax=Flavobacterium fluvii TaxID=468056 RepID=A0A1M5FCR4_9FLAO|nr:M43 family zinc metalloprotease [Flavobacterium fluvii]SHF89324.1 Por secretion system C-terminal sorting domain-containing protein [Flavobacterium fluvii]